MRKLLLGVIVITSLAKASSAYARCRDCEPPHPWEREERKREREEMKSPVPDPPGNTVGAACMMGSSGTTSGVPMLVAAGVLTVMLKRRRQTCS